MIFEKISLNFVFCDLAFETYTSFASAKSSKLMFPSCSKLVQQSQRLVIGKNGGDGDSTAFGNDSGAGRISGYLAAGAVSHSSHQLSVLTTAKKLRKTYCDTVDKLKDAVIDLDNERVLSRELGKLNKGLEVKFEELQRSIVSRAPY
jgi:hypothetical protein